MATVSKSGMDLVPPRGDSLSKKSSNSNTQSSGSNQSRISGDKFMAAAIGDIEWLKHSMRGSRGSSIAFDKNGLAPIHLSAIHGRLECIALLVEKYQTDVNISSSTGWRPIHLCISNQTGKRALQCLQYLLSKGADSTVVNHDGVTPMHQAAAEGLVQCMKLLIDAGAKCNVQDYRGHKPIDLAKLWGHRKCARILAAESWHQEKDEISQEMKEIQKSQMLNVLDEIETAQEVKAEQQVYGDKAFDEWLQNRGLSGKSTGPRNSAKRMQKSVIYPETKTPSSRSREKTGGQLKDSIYRANSKRQPSEDRVPVLLDEGSEKRTKSPTKSSLAYSSEQTGTSLYSRETGESPSLKTKEEIDEKEEMDEKTNKFYNDIIWNYSTHVRSKSYIPNLGDYYPRDEFTMKPKYPLKRGSCSPTFEMLKDNQRAATAGEKSPNISISQMPAEVVDRVMLEQLKRERPVTYKCKNVLDLPTRRKVDVDNFPRTETGLHLTNDVNSHVFKNGLYGSEAPKTASTNISELDWTLQEKKRVTDANRIIKQMREMEKQNQRRRHSPTYVPRIQKQQFESTFGQIII